jgi:hypothetical protein
VRGARTHNTMFLLWCGDVLPKVYIFALSLVSGALLFVDGPEFRGTGSTYVAPTHYIYLENIQGSSASYSNGMIRFDYWDYGKLKPMEMKASDLKGATYGNWLLDKTKKE